MDADKPNPITAWAEAGMTRLHFPAWHTMTDYCAFFFFFSFSASLIVPICFISDFANPPPIVPIHLSSFRFISLISLPPSYIVYCSVAATTATSAAHTGDEGTDDLTLIGRLGDTIDFKVGRSAHHRYCRRCVRRYVRRRRRRRRRHRRCRLARLAHQVNNFTQTRPENPNSRARTPSHVLTRRICRRACRRPTWRASSARSARARTTGLRRVTNLFFFFRRRSMSFLLLSSPPRAISLRFLLLSSFARPHARVGPP